MKTYDFINRKGETITVKGSATIEDLLKVGVTDIRLVPPGTPLKSDSEYRNTGGDK